MAMLVAPAGRVHLNGREDGMAEAYALIRPNSPKPSALRYFPTAEGTVNP